MTSKLLGLADIDTDIDNMEDRFPSSPWFSMTTFVPW